MRARKQPADFAQAAPDSRNQNHSSYGAARVRVARSPPTARVQRAPPSHFWITSPMWVAGLALTAAVERAQSDVRAPGARGSTQAPGSSPSIHEAGRQVASNCARHHPLHVVEQRVPGPAFSCALREHGRPPGHPLPLSLTAPQPIVRLTTLSYGDVTHPNTRCSA